MKREINYAHLGNGISVYDSLHEKNGDYVSVAHIDSHRVIEYRVQLSEEYRREVELYAATADPQASATQDHKVFATRPGTAYRIKRLPGGSDRYGDCEVCGLNVDTAYHLVQFRSYQKECGEISLTHDKTTTKFGHQNCCLAIAH